MCHHTLWSDRGQASMPTVLDHYTSYCLCPVSIFCVLVLANIQVCLIPCMVNKQVYKCVCLYTHIVIHHSLAHVVTIQTSYLI